MNITWAEDVPGAEQFYEDIRNCMVNAVENGMTPESCSMIVSQIAGRSIGLLVALRNETSEETRSVALENFDIGFNQAISHAVKP